MEVGMSLNMLQQQGRPDASVVHEHMAMGDLVEPLGFEFDCSRWSTTSPAMPCRRRRWNCWPTTPAAQSASSSAPR